MTNLTDQKNPPKALAKAIPARPLKLHQVPSNIEQEVRIEIVPLIDVIFCILTFFILGAVGLSRQQAIGVDLPKAQTGTPQMREMLVVSLDEFGQTYVEKQVVTPNQLVQAAQNYHQFNPNGLMVLHASRNTSYNEVIKVLDLLRQVGGERVALATLAGESASPDSLTGYPQGNTPLPGGSLPATPGTSLPSLPQGNATAPSNPLNPASPGTAGSLGNLTPGLSAPPAVNPPNYSPNPAVPQVPPAPSNSPSRP
jgi:biopolymer transport protein ExbD